MDTSEISETGRDHSKFYRAWRITMVLAIAIAIAGFGLWMYGTILDSRRITALEKEVKELKAAAAKPTIDALPAAQAVAPVIVAPVPTAKVEPLPPPASAGEYAVRLHTLYSTDQIKTEEREVFPVFEKCDNGNGISFCVSKIKGQRKVMASLVKIAGGMNDTYAKQVAYCFNLNMRVVGQENAAEPAKLAEFDSACIAATP